ncbi:hypothetical protein SKAU_G00202850 [Synaphobranchus kaupii]|uniref:Uncharacterized protein n=1 Tax=Synaphobranchus kaupii TaxID=118154 RepID=A0A9Q1IY06_SYNKA|nr:hypothetical protein SKAU_G00202850 [Synaphobranchus kaupii]
MPRFTQECASRPGLSAGGLTKAPPPTCAERSPAAALECCGVVSPSLGWSRQRRLPADRRIQHPVERPLEGGGGGHSAQARHSSTGSGPRPGSLHPSRDERETPFRCKWRSREKALTNGASSPVLNMKERCWADPPPINRLLGSLRGWVQSRGMRVPPTAKPHRPRCENNGEETSVHLQAKGCQPASSQEGD